jgi:two-component system, OmpR family, response regulator
MSTGPHILLVDDDEMIRESLTRFFGNCGLRITPAENGSAIVEALGRGQIDLILLDIMIPGEDGLSLCRRLRATNATPIILLTAMSAEVDRITGLEVGADDYVCKPFSPRELLARIRAVLRRTSDGGSRNERRATTLYQFEGWCLDPTRRTLHAPHGALVDLTAGEFELLWAFIEHPQQVLTRDQLLDLAHGRTSLSFDRSIDVQVSRLRRKIEHYPQQPEFIKTVRSGGYVFSVPVVSIHGAKRV